MTVLDDAAADARVVHDGTHLDIAQRYHAAGKCHEFGRPIYLTHLKWDIFIFVKLKQKDSY